MADVLETLTNPQACAEAIFQQLLQAAGTDPDIWLKQILRNCATELAPVFSANAAKLALLEQQFAELRKENREIKKLLKQRRR